MSDFLRPHDCSTPGLPVYHQLPEFTQTHVHRVSDAIQPFHPLSSPSPPAPQSLPASESFPMNQLFAWGGQSTGVSTLASFLPKKSQGWSPSEWTGWISLQPKGLSRVFSNTTVQSLLVLIVQFSINYWVIKVLYILWIQVSRCRFSYLWFANIFPILWIFFTFLKVLLAAQEFKFWSNLFFHLSLVPWSFNIR